MDQSTIQVHAAPDGHDGTNNFPADHKVTGAGKTGEPARRDLPTSLTQAACPEAVTLSSACQRKMPLDVRRSPLESFSAISRRRRVAIISVHCEGKHFCGVPIFRRLSTSSAPASVLPFSRSCVPLFPTGVENATATCAGRRCPSRGAAVAVGARRCCKIRVADVARTTALPESHARHIRWRRWVPCASPRLIGTTRYRHDC